MRFLKKIFAPQEVRTVLAALKDVAPRFPSQAFSLVQEILESKALNNPRPVVTAIRSGISPEQAVYSQIANVAGDQLESGRFHVHRGVLDPFIGEELLALHDTALDEMLRIGAIDSERAVRQKASIRNSIRSAG